MGKIDIIHQINTKNTRGKQHGRNLDRQKISEVGVSVTCPRISGADGGTAAGMDTDAVPDEVACEHDAEAGMGGIGQLQVLFI